MNEQLVTPQINPEPPVVPMEPITPKKSPLVLILVALLVLALSAAVYFYFFPRSVTPPASDNSASPTPVASVVPTADWQTYNNSELGFTVKYPDTYTISKEFNDQYNRATIFQGPDSTFEVMLRDKGEGGLEGYYYMDNQVTKKSKMDGQLANVYIYDTSSNNCVSDGSGPACPQSFVTYVSEYGSDLYHLGFFGDAVLSEEESQILDSFQFTSDSSSEVTTSDQIKLSIYDQNKDYGLKLEELSIKIAKQEDGYAQGTYSVSSGGGAAWWAVELDNVWTVVEIAQEPPQCSVMQKYSFPQSISGECIAK